MPYFYRFDICQAYFVLEYYYNLGGTLQERPSNRRRNMSTAFQLSRMGYKPANHSIGLMSENAAAIYDLLVTRYDLPKGE